MVAADGVTCDTCSVVALLYNEMKSVVVASSVPAVLAEPTLILFGYNGVTTMWRRLASNQLSCADIVTP